MHDALPILCDTKRVLYYEFLKLRETINGKRYRQLLNKL